MMLRTIFVALLFATAAKAAEPPRPVLRRFALIAGANDGGQDRVRLRYATTDAANVGRVLEELGGVTAGDKLVLVEPGRAALEAGIAELGRRMGEARGSAERIELIVYYSGHSDEEGLLLQGERLSYGELRRSLDGLPADVRIAILDSCSSGALTRRKGGKPRPPFLLDASAQVRGHAFLTSSSEHEAAQESDRVGASFFTHYLLSGLRGAADVSADGRVTLSEAYQFAFAETLQRTTNTQSGPQHAAYDIQLAGTGDLVMTDLRSTSAGLVLAEDVGGRMFVRDENQALVAELYKPAGRLVELGLSPGAYDVTLEHDGAWFSAALTLVEGERTTLAAGALMAREPEMTAMRGGAPAPTTYHVEPVVIGVLPGVSVPVSASDSAHKFSLHLAYGEALRLNGLAAGFGVHVVHEEMRGVQLALVGNKAGTAVGVQGAVGANLVSGAVRGVQGSVGFNSAGGDVLGVQGSVGANVAAANLTGIQATAGFNYAGGDLEGIQAAAGVNYAASLRGLQAGVVNVTGDATGAQLGIVNVADKVRGLQLGIINVGDEVSAPIGLFNFIKNGIHEVDVWTTSTEPYNLSVRMGGTRLYSIWSAHLLRPRLLEDVNGSYPKWSASFGLGGRARFSEAATLDFDVSGGGVFTRDSEDEILSRARLLFGYRFAEYFGLFAGAAYNVYVGFNEDDQEKISESPWLDLGAYKDVEGDVTVRRWPSLVFGLTI